MAQIQSGATADLLTIDPVSKAARISLYEPDGTPIVRTLLGSYRVPLVRGRITAAIAATSSIWAIKNGATRKMMIRTIDVWCGFDGTAAATTQQFALYRFTGAAAVGGTALTPVKLDSAFGASTVADCRFNAGAALTAPGSIEANPMLDMGVARGATGGVATTRFDEPWRFRPLILNVNEGLVLRCDAATVVGDSVQGSIAWDEFA